MSSQSKPTQFVALLYKPGGRSQADCIRADTWETREGVIRLYREERVVWRGLASDMAEVQGFADQRSCLDRCKAHRETLAGAGAGTIHLQESGVAPRRHRNSPKRGRTAIPAEGIRVVVEES
jgi:accessory colonization factor AcfC